MPTKSTPATVRILPDEIANKIAAGEVVERPASVVKELVENALDAGATRVIVRLVAAGRRTIEVIDNGSGMSENDAILCIERHATSKIRRSEDLDNIHTLGFRGEALASIAAVSRFELLTRRGQDEAGTRIRVEGGTLRDVGHAPAPVGTRVTVNRLYFNTPARAKFLKGVTTELGQCIDIVQRHALAQVGVAFQLLHNEKLLFDIPAHATLRERAALVWGLHFSQDLVEIEGEAGGIRFSGLIATPKLTRSQRSHQYFFLNRRPVVNRTLQYGLEAGYQELLTIGRHPVAILLLDVHPRFVDVNVHPSKREIRFRDERAAREAIRSVVRERLACLVEVRPAFPEADDEPYARAAAPLTEALEAPAAPQSAAAPAGTIRPFEARRPDSAAPASAKPVAPASGADFFARHAEPVQTELSGMGRGAALGGVAPEPVYAAFAKGHHAAMQVFDTYLLVPDEDRLLIIDQHALHERLNYDRLRAELEDAEYAAQRLAVPLVFDVAPAQRKLLEANLGLFSKLGIDIEPFGDNTFQVSATCHLYEDGHVTDAIFAILDQLGQGNLFDRDDFMIDMLRLATRACKASVRGGDRLSDPERQALLDGFRRLKPPYTCPHGRPIVTEITLAQMEKSFRRRQ